LHHRGHGGHRERDGAGGGEDGVFEGDADLARKAVGEALVVAAKNDIQGRVVPETPGGVADRDELRFTVTRRQKDHEAFCAAGGYVGEFLVNEFLIGPIPMHVGRDVFEPGVEMLLLDIVGFR
jgi:hypothetical protein